MKTIIATTVAGMLALGASSVFAQQTPPQQTQTQTQQGNMQPVNPATCVSRYPQFSQLDTQHQGYISKQGATEIPGLSAIFKQADTNHDGKLTQTEYTTWVQKVCKGHTSA